MCIIFYLAVYAFYFLDLLHFCFNFNTTFCFKATNLIGMRLIWKPAGVQQRPPRKSLEFWSSDLKRLWGFVDRDKGHADSAAFGNRKVCGDQSVRESCGTRVTVSGQAGQGWPVLIHDHSTRSDHRQTDAAAVVN